MQVEQPGSHLVVGRTVAPADVAALCDAAQHLLIESGAAVLMCDVSRLTEADATCVEVLARIALTARRLGCGIRLEHTSPELRALVAFAGLADVLPCEEASGLEPGR